VRRGNSQKTLLGAQSNTQLHNMVSIVCGAVRIQISKAPCQLCVRQLADVSACPCDWAGPRGNPGNALHIACSSSTQAGCITISLPDHKCKQHAGAVCRPDVSTSTSNTDLLQVCPLTRQEALPGLLTGPGQRVPARLRSANAHHAIEMVHACRVNDIPFEERRVHIAKMQNREPQYLAINPLGTPF